MQLLSIIPGYYTSDLHWPIQDFIEKRRFYSKLDYRKIIKVGRQLSNIIYVMKCQRLIYQHRYELSFLTGILYSLYSIDRRSLILSFEKVKV